MTKCNRLKFIIVFACAALLCLPSCTTLVDLRQIAAGSIHKASARKSERTRFSKTEFLELLKQLKPLFEQSGFQCFDDGRRGGFSLFEGIVHTASYGVRYDKGTWLNVSVDASRSRLRIVIKEFGDNQGKAPFTTTQAETDAISQLEMHIHHWIRLHHPHLTFELHRS